MNESTRSTSDPIVICLPESLLRDALCRALRTNGYGDVRVVTPDPAPQSCWQALQETCAHTAAGVRPTLIAAFDAEEVERLLCEFPGLRVLTVAESEQLLTLSQQTIRHQQAAVSLEGLTTLLAADDVT